MYNQVYKILDLKQNYDLILMDLWGVVINNDTNMLEQGFAYSGAAELIKQLKKTHKLIFVSNAPSSQSYILNLLATMNIEIDIQDIVTSGSMTKSVIERIIAEKNSKIKVFNLGKDYYMNLLADISNNIEEVKDVAHADIMLIGASSEGKISDKFDKIFGVACSNNVLGLCVNPDKVFLSNNEQVLYLPGSYAERYIKFGGKVTYVGKPQPEIFQYAISISGITDKSRIIMIGDTMETDIIGAQTAGLHSGLTIHSGNAKFAIAAHYGDTHIEKAKDFINSHVYKPTYFVEI